MVGNQGAEDEVEGHRRRVGGTLDHVVVGVSVEDCGRRVVDVPVRSADALRGEGHVGFLCNAERDGLAQTCGRADELCVRGREAVRIPLVALEEVVGQVEDSFGDGAEPGRGRARAERQTREDDADSAVVNEVMVFTK